MQPDPEIPEPQPEPEEPKEESPPMTAGAAVGLLLTALLVIALALNFGVAQTVAGLAVVVGIPLALLWFVWSLFVRRLWRIRRIRGAQERRELLEAAMRDRKHKS